MTSSPQDASVTGSGNIVVQLKGDGSSVTVGLPWLTLIPVRRRLRSSPVTHELQLLDAYRRTIDIVGRDEDMAGLWEWLHAKRPISVRTVTGRAGAGKTRIAVELMLRLEAERPRKQWWAGFLTSDELRRFVAQQNVSAWGWRRPTLAVMDYAATAAEPLRLCLRELAEHRRNARQAPPAAPARARG